MGKDEGKEESGFGFKDKAKAEETLRLLESHEPQYRRLTVRGLLGRAKRVLSLTKAEDKIKNIKEAMAVFEEWLAQLDKDKQSKEKDKGKERPERKREEKKSEERERSRRGKDSSSDGDVDMEDKSHKKEKSPPPETVPGLGFKDAEAARGTLRALEGRDPDYQRLAVKGLIGRAKRVLTGTKDEGKVSSINEALVIFDKYLEEFETEHRARHNNPYLPLTLVDGCYRLALARGLPLLPYTEFVEAYRAAKGEYKRLRTVRGGGGGEGGELTWDIIRNNALKQLKEKHADATLFESSGEPSSEHLELILWAYSPEAARLKKLSLPPAPAAAAADNGRAAGDRKRRSSATATDSSSSDTSPAKKKKE